LQPGTLLSSTRSQAQPLEVKLDKCDAPVAFGEFFESYSELASRSGLEGYWLERLKELRLRSDVASLCEDDALTVLIAKNRSRSSL
jgi:hypothetical protein